MPVNLTISNMDSKKMMITIERAKGKKDSLIPSPQMLLTELCEYYKEYKPTLYLFEGQEGGM